MNILNKIDEWDAKVAKLQGIKFDGSKGDYLWYTLPRIVLSFALILPLVYLVMTL